MSFKNKLLQASEMRKKQNPKTIYSFISLLCFISIFFLSLFSYFHIL